MHHLAHGHLQRYTALAMRCRLSCRQQVYQQGPHSSQRPWLSPSFGFWTAPISNDDLQIHRSTRCDSLSPTPLVATHQRCVSSTPDSGCCVSFSPTLVAALQFVNLQLLLLIAHQRCAHLRRHRRVPHPFVLRQRPAPPRWPAMSSCQPSVNPVESSPIHMPGHHNRTASIEPLW